MQWNLLSFTDFFLKEIHVRKYVKFARRENKKVSRLSISGHLIRKGFHFWRNLWWLWSSYLHQTMLSFKGMRFCSMFRSNHKKVFGKLIQGSPYLSLFWNNLNFSKNGFHHRRFYENSVKVFRKRRTAALQ